MESRVNQPEPESERLRREQREVENLGLEWQTRKDEFLVGYVSQHRPSQFHTPAIVEMQRRLVVAVQASSDTADRFAGEAQKLNVSIRSYTVALFVLGIVQIVLMFWKG